MGRFWFYIQYAARNLWRSRRWSSFAVFSVAAGVATVVALRSLGLAIGDSLVSNVRSSNHGDITMQRGGSSFLSFRPPEDMPVFSDADVVRVERFAEAHDARVSAYTVSDNIQISGLNFTSAGRPQFISSIFIDPATFPPTQDIFAVDPPGVPLGQLFRGGNEVVISRNLADTQGIKVGDSVRVSGTEAEFIVRGIVATETQAGFRNLMAAFFGFAYFNRELAGTLPVPENPNRISIALPEGTQPAQIEQIENQLRDSVTGAYSMYTVPDLLRQNQNIADVLGSFIVVMGLGALLIGGVGIINTMLVMVGRRTEEIAALKTLGLNGRQIAFMFMTEALLLGMAGSLLGGLFGIVLSAGANAYGQQLIQQPLAFRIYPEAILFGTALGLIVTAVFGVLPVLTAVTIRPAIILRPNETVIPRAGCFSSALAVVLVVVTLGLIAGQMLVPAFNVATAAAPSPYVVGIISVALTLVLLAILVGLLWVVVWFISRLPSFGSADLRLALRNLTTRRIRTATTLLALSAGMFALSSISFVGAGVRDILQFTLSGSLGGNVLIFPIMPAAIANPLIDGRLATIEGVESRTRLNSYTGTIVALDGRAMDEIDRSAIRRQINEAARAGDIETVQRLSRLLSLSSLTLMARDTTGPTMSSGTIIAGRDLTAEDTGQRVAVVRSSDGLAALGLQVGSTLTLRIDGRPYDFTVIGLTPPVEDAGSIQNTVMFGEVIIPPGALTTAPQFQLNIVQIAPEHLNKALIDLSSLPLIYSLDITFIDGILGRFINQFSAIPILVGLLSLGAAAVIMANTVALSMLERRRQIGILKAVGLSGRRVLNVMLLENTLVSLLGGLLGIGLSALGVALMTRFGINLTVLIPTDSLPLAAALVIAAVVIAWAATMLSAQTVLGERVTNVLRYE